jgi:methylenetetrahydrofolate dehydrogenase (NADP+)/methenyltetrahydrofolate cyclohydrolase
MSLILFGRPLADKILEEIKKQIQDLGSKRVVPQLAVILVGKDPASVLYTALKKAKAENLGIKVLMKPLPEVATEEHLIALIRFLNQDRNIHGILVQMPLPHHMSQDKVVWAINPNKDVDGFQIRTFMPPAPMAIIELLKFYGVTVTRKKVAIVGGGFLIGKPLSILMTRFGARVTVLDEKIKYLERRTQEADILISATGQANLMTGIHVKPGQIVVDAGGEWVEKSQKSVTNEVRKQRSESGVEERKVKSQKLATEDFEFQGEVLRREVEPIVKALVPNPGGIGPVTVALLLKNVVTAAKRSSS